MRSRRSRHATNRQQGAVAIIVAIVMVSMLGIAGLALDLGKLYVAKAELQMLRMLAP